LFRALLTELLLLSSTRLAQHSNLFIGFYTSICRGKEERRRREEKEKEKQERRERETRKERKRNKKGEKGEERRKSGKRKTGKEMDSGTVSNNCVAIFFFAVPRLER